jgi:hypothetical protein
MADKLSRTDLKAQLVTAKAELKETLDRVRWLQEFIAVTEKLVGKRSSSPPQQLTNAVAILPQRRRTKGTVLAEQVKEVLIASNRPLHVKEIIEKLRERGQSVLAENPAAAVAVALTRRRDQFERVSGNTFGLVQKEQKATG